MKKKLFSILLIAIMVLASVSTAFAQTVTVPGDGQGSLTIENAANGETYKVVKVFDASSINSDGAIAYYTDGEIPSALANFFEKDSAGNVTVKAGADEEALVAAVQEWAKTQPAVAEAVSDGTVLTFEGLPYGYFAVTSSQGAVVTIDSTNPSATIIDKNQKEPSLTKTIDDDDVSVGDTVTYTVTADTANFLTQNGEPVSLTNKQKQVVSYVFEDTLPDFLTDVTVTSIVIKQDGLDDVDVTKQFVDKKIEIDWTDGNGKSLYKNGAQIVITYTAKVTAQATLGDEEGTGNLNQISLKPMLDDGNGGKDPWDKVLRDEAKTYSYAAALNKVDQDNAPLAGAEFEIAGLTATETAPGEYTVVSYDPNGTDGTTLKTDSEGHLVILGIASDATLIATETKAPDGYNLLTTTATLTPAKTGESYVKSEEIQYYDADGNLIRVEKSTEEGKTVYTDSIIATGVVVVNQIGIEMPGTGGMGVKIIYALGAIFAIGTGIALVTRRKMSDR